MSKHRCSKTLNRKETREIKKIKMSFSGTKAKRRKFSILKKQGFAIADISMKLMGAEGDILSSPFHPIYDKD